MQARNFPLIILGGGDSDPGVLPSEGKDQHPLAGYKGVDLRVGGRALIEVLLERVSACESFDPVYVAGPERVYGPVVGSDRVVDTDGSFGENIRCSLEIVRRAHPGLPVGFLTCDVLPDVGALQRLMADRAGREPCDLWFPIPRAEPAIRENGVSAWKPRYKIVPEPGLEAVEILPGHLVVIDPQALRLDFLYEVFQLAYASRNRPLGRRRNLMIRGVLASLLRQDLVGLVKLRPPTLTWTVIASALSAAGAISRGTITLAHLEDALRKIFATRRHRRQHPTRRVALPITDEISLALDIDTEEEAREMERRLGE